MTSPNTLAIKLKTLMPANGFDQAELARRSGIRPNSISRYLAGMNMPRPAQLAKLAAALHVDIGELLTEATSSASAPAVSNLLCLTQTSDRPGMVRLQIDQSVPGEVATRILELLLEAHKHPAEPHLVLADLDRQRAHTAPAAKAPQESRGNLADILLPRTPQQPEHVRQVLRLDGPPHRPLNGSTEAD
jgi:transcriptional regulator with XRE-family HTH domain